MLQGLKEIEVVTDHRCVLGEGPLWDHIEGRICWVDIGKGEIHEYDPQSGFSRSLKLNQPVNALGLYNDKKFIGVVNEGFAFIGKNDGKIDFIKGPAGQLPSVRFNDGKCDPGGRFWAGTMPLGGEKYFGSLYSLEPDLRISQKLDSILLSNGLCWSEDKRTFYFIDTGAYEIVSFDYDEFTGGISNRKVIIQVDKKDGAPDGMTIDQKGMLWVAHWDGAQVIRWDPLEGRKLLTVPLPVSRPTSCTFGGTNLQDLYITTASAGLSAQQLTQQAFAGALLVIKNCGYRGMENYIFRLKR